jgi:uncharacterized protein involved in exopolysaccharide biosynthesis
MPDILLLIKNWWKRMLAVIALSLLAVGIIVFLKPKQFLSVATAIPASMYSADKSTVFNQNLSVLYSVLGTTDDLDMILGTAHLDTVYYTVTDTFNLYDHYKIKGPLPEMRSAAAIRLKKNTSVLKDEYGQLKIKVWDTDPQLAADLANAIMNTLQSIHTDLKNAGNQAVLRGLKEKWAQHITANPKPDVDTSSVKDFQDLISQYELMVNSRTPALLVVEKARTAQFPDRPKRMQILVATFILAFLFSLLAALFIERKKFSGS